MDANTLDQQHNTEATILVVDDEWAIRDVVAQLLKEEGYRVVTAHNGFEAMDLIDEEPPDLVVSDVMMPVIDGGHLAGIISARTGVPVIGMTALDLLRREADANFWTVLYKPFNLGQLLQAVEDVLAQKAQSRGIAHSQPLR
jgi:two-component system response regulator SaeR